MIENKSQSEKRIYLQKLSIVHNCIQWIASEKEKEEREKARKRK